MRYFLKNLFLYIISLFKTNKKFSATNTAVYFDEIENVRFAATTKDEYGEYA